jgi:hypothetical protein
MSFDKKTSLNDMGGVTKPLQAAFDNLIKFDIGIGLATVTVSDEQILKLATQEATINPLLCGEDCVTSGLKGLLRQAATVCLSKWLIVRGQFDIAIQPYMQKINALQDNEAKKEQIKNNINTIEENIINQARGSKPYMDAEEAKNGADEHYDKIHSNVGGRPVTTFGNSWGYLALLFAITAVEWLVNYDSFFNWTGVPAIAAGFTVAMAVIVAAAAHLHGEYLKQRNSRFGPHSETTARDFGILAFVTFGLLAAITVAGWARYSLAMHSIGAQGPMIQMGDLVPQQANPLIDVYFSLGINLIVWLIGLVVAFKSHDEDHELMRADLDKWRKTKRLNKLYKPWEKRIKLARAQLTYQLTQHEATTKVYTESTKPQRDMMEQVNNFERKMVYGQLANQLQLVVDQYRIALGGALAKQDNHILVSENPMTGLQYAQYSIQLTPTLLQELLS